VALSTLFPDHVSVRAHACSALTHAGPLRARLERIVGAETSSDDPLSSLSASSLPARAPASTVPARTGGGIGTGSAAASSTSTSGAAAAAGAGTAEEQLQALASELARDRLDADRQRAAAADEMRAKLGQRGGMAGTGGVRKSVVRPGSTAEQAATLFQSLEQQQSAALTESTDEKSRADAELRAKLAARKQRVAAAQNALLLDIDLDPAVLAPLFDYLDEACCGRLGLDAIAALHREMHCCEMSDRLVAAALSHATARGGNGNGNGEGAACTVERADFFRVLAAVHLMCRRADQLRWDFALLDFERMGSLPHDAAATLWDFNRPPPPFALKFTEFIKRRAEAAAAATAEGSVTLVSDRVRWDEFEEQLLLRAPSAVQ
jgi:hypothetical protein